MTFQVEYYYKLEGIKSIKMSFSKVSDNNYYLHRPGFNPSSRATYTIFHPSINNFYTTMSVGRALLLNPGLVKMCSIYFNDDNVTLFYEWGPNNLYTILGSQFGRLWYTLACTVHSACWKKRLSVGLQLGFSPISQYTENFRKKPMCNDAKNK